MIENEIRCSFCNRKIAKTNFVAKEKIEVCTNFNEVNKNKILQLKCHRCKNLIYLKLN